MNDLFDIINVNRRWISLSVLIALLLWETLAPFFDFFRHKTRQRIIHGIVNIVMATMNTCPPTHGPIPFSPLNFNARSECGNPHRRGS